MRGPLLRQAALAAEAKCRPQDNKNTPTIRFTSVEHIDIFKMVEIISINSWLTLILFLESILLTPLPMFLLDRFFIELYSSLITRFILWFLRTCSTIN
jgi:hypothetical protein